MTNLNEITYVDWQFQLNSIGGVCRLGFNPTSKIRERKTKLKTAA
jgi:hypothetical protein